MTLQDELDRLREEERRSTPPGVLAVYETAIELITGMSSTARTIREGDRAPDFDLPTVQGGSVSLARELSKGPLILSFFRGGWCPFCSLELRAYERVTQDAQGQGRLLAVSPETLDALQRTMVENRVSFPLLSDPGNRAARSYGLVYRIPEALRAVYEGMGLDIPARNGDSSFELPIPATYLIDTGGIVRRAFIEPDHTRRGEPAEFVQALQRLP
jgi:peroxiredoxin